MGTEFWGVNRVGGNKIGGLKYNRTLRKISFDDALL